MRERINQSMKEAMKSGDKKRLSTLRLVNAAIKDRDIAARADEKGQATGADKIGEQEILALLQKMIKQRRDSAETYRQGGREELAAAEEAGVTIGIENHGHALIATPDSIRYFAELAGSPNLGIALAPYHLPQDEDLLGRLIEDLGPKLVHFYAWQHGMGCMTKLPKEEELQQMPGRGPLDFRPLLAALAKIDYQGWVEIFMHPVPRGIPILDTAELVTAEINRARQYLEKCTRKLTLRTTQGITDVG